MLRGRFDSAGESTPEALRSAYEAVLAETISEVGVSTVAAESGVEEERIRALSDGDAPDITLEEAVTILATDDSYPDAESLEAEARDILLMGMSIAVLDVEAIASKINDELEPKEIQQKIEGRYPITLQEFAMLHQLIEREKR